MYKAILSGSATDKDGRTYRFTAGKRVDAPEGSLSSPSLIWVPDEDKKPLSGTVQQIKDWLDENDVDYPARANKDELLDILRNE